MCRLMSASEDVTIKLRDVESEHFFFSSRRRHTRCSRDWSSDVCSSDLEHDRGVEVHEGSVPGIGNTRGLHLDTTVQQPRSEERRVGKECRSRWSPYH